MKKNKRKIKKKVPKYKYIIASIISIFIVMLPWISRLKLIEISDEAATIFENYNNIAIDLFLYYKEIWIIILAGIIILFFIGEHIFPDEVIRDYPLREKQNKKIYISVGIYMTAVVISSILSKYKELAIMGSPTECEGVFLLLAYMILFLAGINYFSYKKSIKILKTALFSLMTVIILLSLLEFFYKPIFEIPFFRGLLATNDYSELLNSIKNTDFKKMVSLSLYNPNYYGALCILLYPISVAAIFSESCTYKKIYYSVISIGMIFCIFVSKASAAVYILALETIVIYIYYWRDILRNLKFVFIYIFTFIAFIFLINLISNNKLFDVIHDGVVNLSTSIAEDKKFSINNIVMKENSLELEGINNTLLIKLNLAEEETLKRYSFYDKEGKRLSTEIKDDTVTFSEDDFKLIKFNDYGIGITLDIGYIDPIKFYITDDGFKGVGQNGTEIDSISRKNEVLSDYYYLATGRGYAWINTIIMMKDNLLFGTGPGTFAMYFMQNDYSGLLKTHGTNNLVIDKPHSMYLQVASQTGIISLAAVLSIFILCIVQSIKLYRIKRNDNNFSLGLGIFIGVIGFMIVSLVNDSIVVVNPIFWILMGANISIIGLINKKELGGNVEKK